MTDILQPVALEDGAAVALGDGPHLRTLEAWAHWLCEHLDGASVRNGALRAARMDVAERGAQVLQVVHAAMERGDDGFALLGHAVAAGSPDWSDLEGWLGSLSPETSDTASTEPDVPADTKAPAPTAEVTGTDPRPNAEEAAADSAPTERAENGLAPIDPPFGYGLELPSADERGTFDVMVIDVGDDPHRAASILRAGAGDVWADDTPLAPGAVIAEHVAASTVRRLHTLLATPAGARIAVRDR